jgi:hypothetical protein
MTLVLTDIDPKATRTFSRVCAEPISGTNHKLTMINKKIIVRRISNSSLAPHA